MDDLPASQIFGGGLEVEISSVEPEGDPVWKPRYPRSWPRAEFYRPSLRPVPSRFAKPKGSLEGSDGVKMIRGRRSRGKRRSLRKPRFGGRNRVHWFALHGHHRPSSPVAPCYGVEFILIVFPQLQRPRQLRNRLKARRTVAPYACLRSVFPVDEPQTRFPILLENTERRLGGDRDRSGVEWPDAILARHQQRLVVSTCH